MRRWANFITFCVLHSSSVLISSSYFIRLFRGVFPVGYNMCEGPEAEKCLTFFRNLEEAAVAERSLIKKNEMR